MTRTPVFARVVAFQRAFLLAIALKDRGVQVERVALTALGQTLHLPLGERWEEALHVAHREPLEQITDGVVGGETFQAQQLSQGLIPAQPISVRETLGARQNRQ